LIKGSEDSRPEPSFQWKLKPNTLA